MDLIINENTLEKTARLLLNAYNIKVVFEEGQPGIKDANTIRLPPIDYLNSSAEQINAMQGYLDNQVAKLLFSDVPSILKHNKDKVLMEVFNTIEQPRVEPLLQKQYPGTEYNLQNIYEYVAKNLLTNWHNVPFINKILFSTFMEKRYPGNDFVKEAFNKSPELKEYVDYVTDLIKNDNPTNTFEALETAKKIKKILVNEDPLGGSKHKKEKTSHDGEVSENSSSVEEESSEDSVEKDVPKKSGKEPSKPDMKKVADSADNVENLMDIPSSIEKALPPDKKDYKHGLSGRGYTIYTTENDVVAHAPVGTLVVDGPKLQKLRDENKRNVGVIKTRLVNTLRTMQRTRWTSNKYEGKLDSKRAYKSVLGISDAVYKTKDAKLKLDVAIALAIDQSGSMGGCNRINVAAQSALVLGDVFSQLNIPFLIYGFSTVDSVPMPTSYDARRKYSRCNAHWIQIYSEFNDNWKKQALSLLNVQALYNNLDGESVRWGCQQLLMQPQKRKILIVFNDGYPEPGYGNVGDNQTYLKKVVNSAVKAGIEVIAFGIQSDAVTHYYPNYVLIDNVNDLIKEPLIKLEGMLRKGMY